MNVTIYFKDGDTFNATDVEVVDDVTRLIIVEPNEDYSVVPLVNVKFYDVEVG